MFSHLFLRGSVAVSTIDAILKGAKCSVGSGGVPAGLGMVDIDGNSLLTGDSPNSPKSWKHRSYSGLIEWGSWVGFSGGVLMGGVLM